MRKQMPFSLSFTLALAFAFGFLFAPRVALAQKISKTAMAGDYSVTLKVLPAESFTGTDAAMSRDGGAEPNDIKGPEHPNHHLVAFVKKDGKPVEKATVSIRYREVSPERGGWMSLPVVRMHMTGMSRETTHYGNNVKLGSGSYEARVTVNGSEPAVFHFSLSK
jgi:hypothetical protein